MGIPAKRVIVDLKKVDPSQLTPEDLQKQLNNIGLTCEYTNPTMLKKFIRDVKHGLPDGRVETYQILEPSKDKPARLFGLETDLDEAAKGNWEPDGTGAGYSAELQYIIYPQHFEWLQQNRPSFTGKESEEKFIERYDSVDSIKQAYVNLGVKASQSVIGGLNKDSIEAVFSDLISALNDTSAKDYDKEDSRVLYLVEDYDPTTKNAAGIGALSIKWRLIIKDYKEKKEAIKHDTELHVWVHAMTYSDLAVMEADIQAAKAQFKGNSFDGAGYLLGGIPVKDTSVEIFDKRPAASAATFRKSLPLESTDEKASVMVLYAPDLKSIGSLDNQNSAATSTYSKSVTTGFSFSMSQGIKAGAEFEAGIVLVKGKVSVEVSLSFTETWNKSTTETISFTVPPSKKAFTYQGTIRSQVLEYDPSTDLYKYKQAGVFQSPVLATFDKPISPNETAMILKSDTDA